MMTGARLAHFEKNLKSEIFYFTFVKPRHNLPDQSRDFSAFVCGVLTDAVPTTPPLVATPALGDVLAVRFPRIPYRRVARRAGPADHHHRPRARPLGRPDA